MSVSKRTHLSDKNWVGQPSYLNVVKMFYGAVCQLSYERGLTLSGQRPRFLIQPTRTFAKGVCISECVGMNPLLLGVAPATSSETPCLKSAASPVGLPLA